MKEEEEEECEACKALRRGTTWIGNPPKCQKHKKKVSHNKYYRSSKTLGFAGNNSNYMG